MVFADGIQFSSNNLTKKGLKMEEKWYYSFDGKQFGPTTKEALLAKIKPDTLVYSKKIGRWIQASEVSELGFEVPPLIPNVKQVSSKKESSPLVLLIMFVLVPALILGSILGFYYINSEEYKKDKEFQRLKQGAEMYDKLNRTLDGFRK